MASTTTYTNYEREPSRVAPLEMAILSTEQTLPRSYTRMSWSAIFAGTAVAVATSLLLSLVGLACGLGISEITIGAGIWMILTTIISMAAGGYVAGRLAGTFSHLDSELHGLTVWALTALLSAILLVRLVAAELSPNGRMGSMMGSAFTNESGLQMPNGPGLNGRLEQSLNTGGDPALMTQAQRTGEINLLIDRRVANGSFAPSERNRLIALLMQRDGLNYDEATLRIARMEQVADSVAAREHTEEENTANLAQVGARGVSSSLLLGLAAALFGAWFGTRHVRSITVARSQELLHDRPQAYAHTGPQMQPLGDPPVQPAR